MKPDCIDITITKDTGSFNRLPGSIPAEASAGKGALNCENKKAPERNIVMKVKNGLRKNIAVETEKSNKIDKPLSPDLLRKINAYWRAANYLSVGQLYLHENPLLCEPLKLSHVKAMLLGHWGTTPGQNFIYVHLNRVIKK
jgi:hypothetical protein